MNSQVRNTNKYLDLLIVIIVVFTLPNLSILISGLIYPNIQNFDPDEVFIYKTVHHIVQLLLTIITMFLLSTNNDLKQWGFNLNNWQNSLKWIGFFFIIWSSIQYFGISQSPFHLDYELTNKNKIGVQFFQYFLSGTGEEPLFRGFVMIYLMKYWNEIFKIGKVEIPVTLFFATILFMMAHIHIDFTNFNVTHFDIGQQMNSLQLGIIYGLSFHYTKSLLAPIVMHGISNGIIYSIMFYAIS